MEHSGVTPIQCRMARAGVRMSQKDLAKIARVSTATLAEFEAGRRTPYDRTLKDIRTALESNGVQFLEVAGGWHGVQVLE